MVLYATNHPKECVNVCVCLLVKLRFQSIFRMLKTMPHRRFHFSFVGEIALHSNALSHTHTHRRQLPERAPCVHGSLCNSSLGRLNFNYMLS